LAIDYIEHDKNIEAYYIKLPTYLNLSVVCVKLGEFKNAVDFADKALQIDPNNVKGYFRKAQARSAFGNLEEAKEELEKALKIDPGNSDILNEL